jgi:titin
VQFSSSPRRALGLLAAGTIGLSTALLGVTAVAQAAPGDTVAADAPVEAVLAVPPAPDYLEVDGVGDGSLTVSFLVYASEAGVQADATGYEISTDNGSNFAPLATETPHGNNQHVGTVTGLTNKQAYDLVVRATSTVGPSEDSNVAHGTPAKPNGAPVGLTVTTAPGKVTASWSAPTDAGSYAVDSYDVGLFQPAGPDGGGMGGQLCQTTAAVFTCTGDADFGTEWQVSVTAIDTEGNWGVSSAPVATGAIPFPATVPASNGPLTPAAGTTDKVVAGKPMTFSGTGYMPGSTVTVLIYSEPQVLTTVVADPSGNFTVTVTVPAGLAAGQHTLVAAGVDTLGNDRFMTLAVTVSAGGVATLAYTGTDVTVPAIAGLAAVAVGAGLIVASRRRRDAA